MTVEMIVETVTSLIGVHDKMTELAREKTEILKNADMPALEAQLKKEEPLIEKIKELEQLRIVQIDEYLQQKGQPANAVSLTEFLNACDGVDKEIVTSAFENLMRSVHGLKQQNQLNQQLIEQSLQFVNVTADLLQPGNDSVNYGKPTSSIKQSAYQQRSLFDSKA